MEPVELLYLYAKDIKGYHGSYLDVCITISNDSKNLIISDINGTGFDIRTLDGKLTIWNGSETLACDLNDQSEFDALLNKIRTFITSE